MIHWRCSISYPATKMNEKRKYNAPKPGRWQCTSCGLQIPILSKCVAQITSSEQPIVGLLLALILVLLILALLLALFLARFCCCCARRVKDEDEIYQRSTVRGSKILEPILVATPPHERIYGTQADAIYSTPYS
ncbi:unnamed protein product, partial [Gongylonema pulchrum]|uniref:Uncharacterized protein n=1 Tax=Gongylonema pulchrum TaxID=637853 RepID=A0A183EQ54_9BILA